MNELVFLLVFLGNSSVGMPQSTKHNELRKATNSHIKISSRTLIHKKYEYNEKKDALMNKNDTNRLLSSAINKDKSVHSQINVYVNQNNAVLATLHKTHMQTAVPIGGVAS